MATKRIGIMTSGGDCAGLNAAIRAVVRRAIHGHGWQVMGIRDGSAGLMVRPVDAEELSLGSVGGDLIRRGGTILGTINKGDPFAYPMPDGSFKDRSAEVVDGLRQLGVEAVIVIGGDGSMRLLSRLCQLGKIPMIGIPKTIDNDVAQTECAIGFDTAVSVACEALDRLAPTAASHHRVMILEVMGRDVGHIALTAGVSGGADVILIPELPYSLEGIAHRLQTVSARGRKHALMVVAEGCRTETGDPVTIHSQGEQARYGGIGHYLAERLKDLIDAETRVTVLGHVQRGGMPSMRDRMIASAFGVHAVDLLAEGQADRVVVWQNGAVDDVPLSLVAGKTRAVDPYGTLVNTARGLGLYVGE